MLLVCLSVGHTTISFAEEKKEFNIKDIFHTDWDEGTNEAKKKNKPVFAYFTSEHCGSCRAMEKNTFAAPGIKKRLAVNWVSICINTSKSVKSGTFDGKTMNYYKLSKYFRVNAVPTFVFLDTDLKPIQSIVGFRNKEIFAPILDYMKDEAYKKGISFKEFREKSEKSAKVTE